MPFVKLDLPPGIHRNGTLYENKNRWYDAGLVRWTEGVMQPVGGWSSVSTNPFFADISKLILPGTNGNSASTPDASVLDITGDIDIRATVALDDWTPASDSILVDKLGSNGGYRLLVTSAGNLEFVFGDGSANQTATSTSAPANAVDGERLTVRVTLDVDNGSGGYTVSFYERQISYTQLIGQEVASKSATWSLISQTTTGGTTSVGTNTVGLFVGTAAAGGLAAAGDFYASAVLDGINGSVEFLADFTSVVDAASSFTEDSDNAATVTINTSGSPSAEIDLDTAEDSPICGMSAAIGPNDDPMVVVGTPRRVWSVVGDGQANRTPSDFDAGDRDAVEGTLPRDPVTEAQTWVFDSFGEDLVAVAHSDGKIRYMDSSTGGSDFDEIDASAPTDNLGVVVTPERFIVALGAGGNPTKVQWADQESTSTWTAALTNQAGDFILDDSGELMMGRSVGNETLLWTTHNLYTMRYIGGTLVYSFDRKGADCGPISRRAEATIDSGQVVWMGDHNFFLYDGFVQDIPCTVSDYVFGDLNETQASKISAVHVPKFQEVWWFYPSSGSLRNDRYVAYSYVENTWMIGNLERSAGIARGDTGVPMMADEYGNVYDHETGTSYDDVDGNPLTPFAESGPFELGVGDRLMFVRQIIPDEASLGDVMVKLLTRLYPTASETTNGPFTLTNPTSVRVTGRQIRMRVEQASTDWRLGDMRLDVVEAEGR